MSDRKNLISDFEYEVQKADAEGWDFVDLTTEDGFEILDMLKAQEPMVLTLEEAANRLKEPVFLEWKAKSRQSYTGWVLVYDVQKGMGITGVRMGLTQPGHITSWYPIDQYDIKWRCWSAKPSDEQREGTPWEK